ncbi:hypothetical protein [Ancylobacter pratisalsi]|uniref:Uncharacterized protein n=1 Tax=Ancylobacter pratisalsi TaxID=1745854 RepID=A0A6P1YSX3_9HYPH|nr:hypothetical protein [Ancylobacter pratisalsi]QIB35796.1 hypothetical protein G3A50_20340 [Ancylobacter pratisalsi]
MKIIVAACASVMLAGCVTESAQFKPSVGQETLVRDGQPALVSTKSRSIVLIRPASRHIEQGARPIYIVAVMNTGATPVLMSTNDIAVEQTRNGEVITDLKVLSYDDLVREEKNRQIMRAVAVGVSSAANSYSASQAGYYQGRGTVYTPRGPVRYTVSGYDPAAAALAQANASATNSAMIRDAVETGQRNMATLEQQVLKDNTVMPGEWVGGQVHIAPPVNDPDGKFYRIRVVVGSDVHEIDIAQVKSEG